MKIMRSEDQFRTWVIAAFEQAGGHVQGHEDRNSTGIPDISASLGGRDYWLELKYGEFTLDTYKGYDKFEYKEVTRKQLEWLRLRQENGAAICGILGYFNTKPSDAFHGVSFMSPQTYLKRCWRNDGDMNAGAAMFSPYTENADLISGAGALTRFIIAAHAGIRLQRS